MKTRIFFEARETPVNDQVAIVFNFCTFLAERMVQAFLDQSQNKVKLKRNNSGLLSVFN